ncbi:MAG: hypothetical protein AABP62_07930 [Planctomycetota bacterium]
MPRIFISCVTAEFRAYRVQIAQDFRSADCEVKSQEDLPQVAVGTIRKLDEIIRSCDAVIHILGRGAGAMADSVAVTEYLNHERKFLKVMQAVGDFRTLKLTYTQWEAYLAAYRNKPIFVYEAEPSERDEHPPLSSGLAQELPTFEPNPNDAELVRAHRQRLEKLPTARYPTLFKNLAGLMGKFLGDLLEIRKAATKADVSTKLHERFGRHKVDELKDLLRAKGEPLLEDGFLLAAFVQITGTLPDSDAPDSVVMQKDRTLDFMLVDILAEYESPFELLGLVKACQVRSKAKGLKRLASSLETWFSGAIKAFNETVNTLHIGRQNARTDVLTTNAVTGHCAVALQYLKPDSFPTPSLELAWRVVPADPMERVFAEGYLRWGRHHSKVSLKSDASILAKEVPTRFVKFVEHSGKYMDWLIERLEVFVSERELHLPWEYETGSKPNEEKLLSCPVVLRLLHRGMSSGKVIPPSDPINSQCFASRPSRRDTFLIDVRSSGGFFAVPIDSEDDAELIQTAAAQASIGFWLRRTWLRKTKPIEDAERCFAELDGQFLASVPRLVFEKKLDSPKDSAWREMAVFYDHPQWPVFKFSSDEYGTEDLLRINDALSGI